MEYFPALLEGIQRQPRWLQPVLWGSVFLPAWMYKKMCGKWGVAIFLGVCILSKGWWGVLLCPGLFLLVAVAGAAGGLVYSVLSPFGALGGMGNWLRWSAGAATYLCVVFGTLEAMGFPIRHRHRGPVHHFSMAEPVWQLSILVVSLFYGGIAAWITREEQ
jgi:hypothetical protein